MQFCPTIAEKTGLEEFAAAVIEGLQSRPKTIPCRFLYDARGSELFEQITRLPEYYLTRTEIALLETYAGDIAALAGEGHALIEFGSGSSRKTEILIAAMPDLNAYVAIDISSAALTEAACRLRQRFPGLPVVTVAGDFSGDIALPEAMRGCKKVGFFPGSTIGNFTRAEARGFLSRIARFLGPDGALLIGVDLKKDPDTLIAAYDDAAGVTAEFNLNLLRRINRELGGTFDLSGFAHEAVYNAKAGRIELYLKSLLPQTATVADHTFTFAKGERIHTENSHKYTVDEFAELICGSGWKTGRVWTDANLLFSLHYLCRSF